ncbi:MAG: dinitrogenase iron-molybdenum cofactor biosynthesis protein [Sulfurimonas sp.]|nr:dinitrogenase iron-molybdenum cofactor biosynthesis protein [Sulfurimonas sp.]
MKIVFTAKGDSWDSQMDARFGRMELLVTYDEASQTLQAATNSETESMEHGAGLQTAQKVLELEPDVIITGNGAGQKALEILKRSNVKMFVGAGDMTIKEAYEAFKADKLKTQF